MLNLGTEFSIPRGSWVELTNRIEAILHHQPSLLVVNKTIEAEAQRIVSKLLQRQKEYAPIIEDEPTVDYCTVDVDSVQSSELRSVGVEYMAYDALQSLQLDSQLALLGLNRAEVMAENLLLKQQLMTLTRQRTRSPVLTTLIAACSAIWHFLSENTDFKK